MDGPVPILATLLVGLLLGIRHAMDADHLVAVGTILARTGRISTAAWVGTWWGLGHALTVGLVGLGVIGFKITIAPSVATGLEFLVAAMLVFLGVLNLLGWGMENRLRAKLGFLEHEHEHRHDLDSHGHHLPFWDQQAHSHPHPHELSWLAAGRARAFLVGMVHGLAGSAAIALLVLTTLPSSSLGLVYLAGFSAGAMMGMMGISLLMAYPISWMARELGGVGPVWLSAGTGILSLGFGAYMICRLAGVSGG